MGSEAALAATPRLIDFLKGTNELDQLGWHCEGIGDINGDDLGDFIICQERNPEKMMVYLGGPHPFDSAPVLTIPDYNDPHYLGDVDCDGTPDFMAVCPTGDTARLYLGMENYNPDDYIDFISLNEYPNNYGGFLFSSWGGDNNNDGGPDFWLYYRTGASGSQDTLFGFSTCSALDIIPDFHIYLNIAPDNKYRSLSRTVCSNCDLNGDSIPDIVFGQYTSYYAYPGRVCVVWGGSQLSDKADLMFYAPGMGAIDDYLFGSDLACMGDISGDGIDDLWVRQGGRNYAYFGGRPFDTIPDVALDYSYTDKVEMVGDINDDGWNDIMLIYTQNSFSQIALLYCGPGMDTIIDRRYTENDFRHAIDDTIVSTVIKLGQAYSWVGDVDGDHIDDILVNGDDGVAKGWAFLVGGWHDPLSNVTDETGSHDGPLEMTLQQNYPNPFNSQTKIPFYLPGADEIELRVYNILGEIVSAPLSGRFTAGWHEYSWDPKDIDGNPLPSGVYFYYLKFSEGLSTARKMILIK